MNNRFFIFFCLIISMSNLMADENFMTLDINFRNEIVNNKLRFIIYYNGPRFISSPLRDQEIRNGEFDYKIVVNSNRLNTYFDLFNQLTIEKFEKCNEQFMLYARAEKRILCEFRDKDDNLLISFSHGLGDYIILNDTVIKKNRALYNLIKFFLPRNIDFYGEIEE